MRLLTLLMTPILMLLGVVLAFAGFVHDGLIGTSGGLIVFSLGLIASAVINLEGALEDSTQEIKEALQKGKPNTPPKDMVAPPVDQ